MNTKSILAILFLFFGIIAFINPNGRSLENLEKNYSVSDLIRGWAIYSITIGLLLYYPNHLTFILIFCFIISILWHFSIIKKRGWTRHHKGSIGINIIALILASQMIRY
jgi:hypothetical protein